MDNTEAAYRSLPGVDTLLAHPPCAALVEAHGRALVVFAIREVLSAAREAIMRGENAPDEADVLDRITSLVSSVSHAGLTPVFNATGVVLHTNLGRAVLGEAVMAEVSRAAIGYSNLEFDLSTGRRGHRTSHLIPLLRFITGAEDCVVVNNNAAAIVLVLSTLAKRKEVLVSRGELIEIGGAFRIPDIMRAAGAKMVEVGTTNRTRLSDYEEALSSRTALIMKAHKSNYTMSGFTEEVGEKELAGLARAHGIALVYDVGSGLLRRPAHPAFRDEPDVAGAIADGADVVTFSCDKLLGGPQAGIAAGSRALISKCAKAPLMRAVRVGKLTIAALSAACRHYLSDSELAFGNPTFRMLQQSEELLHERAKQLVSALGSHGVAAEIVESTAHPGGGTLPHARMKSRGVRIGPPEGTARQKERFAERLFHALLEDQTPVVGVLREGSVILDVYALADRDIPAVAGAVSRSCRERRA